MILIERICKICGEPVLAKIGDLPDEWICSYHKVDE